MQAEPESIRLLHVEDSDDDHLLLRRHFSRNEVPVEWRRVDNLEDFECALNGAAAWGWDAILCDHHLDEFDSAKALAILGQYRYDIPFVIVSGAIGEMGVLEAMKAGAHDYVPKDDLFRLIPALRREMEEAALREEKRRSDERLRESNERLRHAVETLTQTQEHLTRVEKLRSLGEIASGVAHDFNNGLTKILGIAEILIERCPDERAALNDLLSVAQDSAKVVHRLRDFYANRTEADDAVSVDLSDVIRQSVRLTEPKWKTESEVTRQSIVVEAHFESQHHASADDSELREVFTNLIFNACDAMPEGGAITISTRDEPGFVAVTIADTGIGMNREILSRCREPFFTTKGENGTGLGLGLAESVVKRYGGRLDIQSREGEGTVVSIRLPIHEAPSTAPSTSESESPGGDRLPPCRVLVVDDDPLVVKILKKFLELDGHTVATALTGMDALRELESASWDIVITDRAMPSMNGDELCRTLKERNPSLPVIMSSGYDDISEHRSERDPIDFVLPKPVNRNSLRQALSRFSLS